MTARRTRFAILAASLVSVTALSAAAWWIVSLGPAPLGNEIAFSSRVVDRDGRLLRAYATGEGRWRLPARSADVDPRFFDLLFAYEDKRFRAHHGVDPRALGRAAVQLAGSGRIRSGGSTLTMQVARLLEPRGSRSFVAKIRQIVRAIQIERALWRQHRGHPRRVARIFRQGAAPALAWRSGAAGGVAAIAGGQEAGPIG
jgi:penicillin-binding protein 1C